jgi:thimet oligopeptidase
MKTLPLSQKDFAWVNMTEGFMKKTFKDYLENKKKVYKDIKNILPEKRTYLNTLYALERCDDKFQSFTNKVGFLSEVSPKKEIRIAANKLLTEVSEKLVDIEYDRDLYISLLEYYEGNFLDEKKLLRKEDIKLLTETIREYRRMGFDLPDKMQNKLKTLLKKASTLSIQFRNTISEYQDYILCTEKELDGLSERFISTLPRHTDGRYIVSLQYPHVFPYLAEAKNRKKREELAKKNLKKGGAKNLKILNQLVALRHEIAHILGYAHHADFRLETRMVKNAKTAVDFSEGILKKIAPLAKRDIEELKAYAKTIGIEKMEHFDVSFVGNELKKKLYEVDPEVVRGYFSYEHVRDEMFSLFGNLFSIKIHPAAFKLWHKDVKAYEVSDKEGLIGYFTMDMFPREGKYGHAAMFDIVIPHEEGYKSEKYLAPLSAMVCNFPTPNKKMPSLLSIGEVETLFHEFGHCLHMTLSKARLESQAGASVAWDFVEAPSQMMENWVWNRDVLKKISKHYVTGKHLDDKTIEKILKGKAFQNGYFYTRQIVQGKLDLDLHTGKVTDATKAYREMNKKYFSLDLPVKETLFPAGFGHLVGYDAAYYSYLWSLVYACDAFESFKTKGNKNILTNKEVGMQWRKEVLEKGSSDEEMKLIMNFLGRKPSDKAFLKELGVK